MPLLGLQTIDREDDLIDPVIVLTKDLGILLAGLTSIPGSDWWQNSALAAPLTAAALELKDWLPSAWAERLDFSPGRPASREGGTRVALPAQRET